MTEDNRGDSDGSGEDPFEGRESTDDELDARITAAAARAAFTDLDPRVTERNLHEATLQAIHLCGLPSPRTPRKPGTTESSDNIDQQGNHHEVPPASRTGAIGVADLS